MTLFEAILFGAAWGWAAAAVVRPPRRRRRVRR